MQKFTLNLPEYQNIDVEIELTFWTNKPTIRVNGTSIPPTPGNSRSFLIPMPDRTETKLEFKGFTIDYQPRIFLNGKLLNIVRKLKWYEWLPAALPASLIFIGGAIGGLCAFIGVTTNFKVLRSNQDRFNKIAAVLGTTIASFLGYAILNWILTTIIQWFKY